jgi:2-dehydro-3-deoxygalactonokinase
MIGIDWGTSSFRAFRLADGRSVTDRRSAPRGIMSVTDGKFADVVREFAGDWIRDGESRILLSGMIGSRQGWRESQALQCPAGVEELARALTSVPFDDAQIFIVPGLTARDEHGTPEFMRGEETQIAGLLPTIGARGLVCLPGTHSKWVRIEQGRIAGFTTHLTGEAFAALSQHTILGRLMQGETQDEQAFDRGVKRSADSGGLLHHLFGARTLVLAGLLAETGTKSYLSGLLIGHEVRAALAGLPPDVPIHLAGDANLCRLYARAIKTAGRNAMIGSDDVAILGLARIGGLVQWT